MFEVFLIMKVMRKSWHSSISQVKLALDRAATMDST
jgi:hypothetical protein